MKEWSEEEIRLAKLLVTEHPMSYVAKELGRTTSSVHNKLRKLGVFPRKMRGNRCSPPPNAWTKEEIAFLKKNSKRMTLLQLSVHLGRSVNAIKIKCSRIEHSRRKKGWSYDEMTELLRLRDEEKLSWVAVSKAMKRSLLSCKSKYFYLVSAV